MKKHLKSSLIFIILNFIGLAIGGLWTNEGVTSDWYNNILKAPWTPPGWVFGAAWTTIAITFGIGMSEVWKKRDNELLILFVLSFLLNIIWNPLFFSLKAVGVALIVILNLSLLIFTITHYMRVRYGKWYLWCLPYFVWLQIATSLNLFILLMN
jgi:tryptophan-rich sensory protein